MENSHHGKAYSLMLWKEKKKARGVTAAEATAGVAAVVRELALAAGALARQLVRTSPAKGRGARQFPGQLLLWGRMVGFVLVVAASLQIACKTKTFPVLGVTRQDHTFAV